MRPDDITPGNKYFREKMRGGRREGCRGREAVEGARKKKGKREKKEEREGERQGGRKGGRAVFQPEERLREPTSPDC